MGVGAGVGVGGTTRSSSLILTRAVSEPPATTLLGSCPNPKSTVSVRRSESWRAWKEKRCELSPGAKERAASLNPDTW